MTLNMDIQTDFYCHTAAGDCKREYPKVTGSIEKRKTMSPKKKQW